MTTSAPQLRRFATAAALAGFMKFGVIDRAAAGLTFTPWVGWG